MKREVEPNWDEVFKSVEKDARLTLNDEIRKQIIEAYHSYFDVNGGPRLSSKQIARARTSLERHATCFLIALQSCHGDMSNCIYSDDIPASMSSSEFYVMTKSLNAFV